MALQDSVHYEHTIKSELMLEGTMALSGRPAKLYIKPAKVGTGIHFIRRDISNKNPLINARWNNVSAIKPTYSLGNEDDVYVHRVDCILAALYCSGIDNAIIEIDGSEIPYIYNQPANMLQLIRKTGLTRQDWEKQVIWINRNIEVQVHDIYATFMPYSSLRISFNTEQTADGDKDKIISFTLPRTESHKHASHRYVHQIKTIEERKLISPNKIENITSEDELPCINKSAQCRADFANSVGIVSILSTLTLTGLPIMGHLYTNKPNNEILHLLVGKLFDEPHSWSYMSYSDLQNMSSEHIEEVI